MAALKPLEQIIKKNGKDPWQGHKGPLPPYQFKELLLQIMDQKNHWAWQYFSGGGITKSQLKIHFQQEYEVYVRDFPVFLSRIHAKSPPLEVRRDLARVLTFKKQKASSGSLKGGSLKGGSLKGKSKSSSVSSKKTVAKGK